MREDKTKGRRTEMTAEEKKKKKPEDRKTKVER